MLKRIICAGVSLVAAHSASAAILYEPFDYTDPGTTLGASSGTTPTHVDTYVTPNQAWRYAEATQAADQPFVFSGSLSYAGLPSSIGNSANTDRTKSNVSRINVPSAINSGTVYFSEILRVNDMTNIAGNLGTGTGSYTGGLNATAGSGAGNGALSSAASAVLIRETTATTYEIGVAISVQATGATTLRQYDTANEYAQGDRLFIVGSYTFNAGADNDVTKIWVYKNDATIPDEPGTPNAISASSATFTGTDSAQIASFFLRNNGVEPAQIQYDEVRIDSTWAGVTNTPEPASLAVFGIVGASLTLRRRKA
jgi:hypothetical protein